MFSRCKTKSVELVIGWLNLHPDTSLFIAEDNFYIKVDMPKDETAWYSTSIDDPRFTEDIAKTLLEYHEEGAHLYALEKLINNTEGEQGEKLWKAVLKHLDREN